MLFFIVLGGLLIVGLVIVIFVVGCVLEWLVGYIVSYLVFSIGVKINVLFNCVVSGDCLMWLDGMLEFVVIVSCVDEYWFEVVEFIDMWIFFGMEYG